MKVAIVGAQCVGKTTLIDDIIAAMPEFTKPSYTYRDAIKDAGAENKMNRDTCEETQWIIFNALAESIKNSGPNTIHYRSVMDAVAYTIWPIIYRAGQTDITPGCISRMKNTAIELMELYDLVVYIPVDESIELVNDDLRDTDPDFRTQYAEIIEDLLILDISDPLFDKYGYKVVSISGSREARVADFKEIINVVA